MSETRAWISWADGSGFETRLRRYWRLALALRIHVCSAQSYGAFSVHFAVAWRAVGMVANSCLSRSRSLRSKEDDGAEQWLPRADVTEAAALSVLHPSGNRTPSRRPRGNRHARRTRDADGCEEQEGEVCSVEQDIFVCVTTRGTPVDHTRNYLRANIPR